jgi:Phospholipid N-methyltransferase
MGLPGLRLLERKFEGPIRLFELKKCALEKQIERQLREFEHKRNVGLDDDLRFIRSWLEKPLAIGAVKPSGKVLARTMAQYVDPDSDGPVIELGPGTGPVTQALVEQGVDPSRLVLVEFNAAFCRLLRARYPQATVVQGDAYGLRRLLDNFLYQPAAAIVSGLPLMTKPARIRLRLIADA